jgi:hypothetical protein
VRDFKQLKVWQKAHRLVLDAQVNEVKRMLNAFIQRLT